MFKFDLHNGIDWLRVVCGAFLLPHAWGKLFAQGPLKFFTAAGFRKPRAFMFVALVIEVVTAGALLFGVWYRAAAWLTAALLLGATGAVLKVTKGKWIWLDGGCEYTLFWALCCVIVAMYG